MMEDSNKQYIRGEIDKTGQSSSVGLIIRQKEPNNLETPFDQVDSFLTPMELFYIRSHFPTPKLIIGERSNYGTPRMLARPITLMGGEPG